MCALEIGNPKTDAASAVKDQRLSDQGSLPSLADLAPTALTYPDMLRVVDHLLAQDIGWQSGHTLPQTVFTCLYLLHPER